MTLISEVTDRREQILNIAKRHGAVKVNLFGSVAKGKESESSDIDFLVEWRQGDLCLT